MFNEELINMMCMPGPLHDHHLTGKEAQPWRLNGMLVWRSAMFTEDERMDHVDVTAAEILADE